MHFNTFWRPPLHFATKFALLALRKQVSRHALAFGFKIFILHRFVLVGLFHTEILILWYN